MSDLIKFDPALLNILKGGAGLGAPMPFARDILALETRVAGTSYLDDPDALAAAIKPGDILAMKREPQNEYDELAILLFTERGEKAGYIPRAQNEVIARLMDAGKTFFARIEDFHFEGEWLCINIKVFMKD